MSAFRCSYLSSVRNVVVQLVRPQVAHQVRVLMYIYILGVIPQFGPEGLDVRTTPRREDAVSYE